jgi:hypothetical protein
LYQNEIRWRWNAGEEETPMLRVVTDEPTREHTAGSVLVEIVREGARRMLAAALEAESTPASTRMPMSATRTASDWWSATDVPTDGRSRPGGVDRDPSATRERQARG